MLGEYSSLILAEKMYSSDKIIGKLFEYIEAYNLLLTVSYIRVILLRIN